MEAPLNVFAIAEQLQPTISLLRY